MLSKSDRSSAKLCNKSTRSSDSGGPTCWELEQSSRCGTFAGSRRTSTWEPHRLGAPLSRSPIIKSLSITRTSITSTGTATVSAIVVWLKTSTADWCKTCCDICNRTMPMIKLLASTVHIHQLSSCFRWQWESSKMTFPWRDTTSLNKSTANTEAVGWVRRVET